MSSEILFFVNMQNAIFTIELERKWRNETTRRVNLSWVGNSLSNSWPNKRDFASVRNTFKANRNPLGVHSSRR